MGGRMADKLASESRNGSATLPAHDHMKHYDNQNNHYLSASVSLSASWAPDTRQQRGKDFPFNITDKQAGACVK